MNRTLWCCAAMSLVIAGCAGMPNLPNVSGLPIPSGVKGLAPTGGGGANVITSGIAAVSTLSEGEESISEADEIGMGEQTMMGALGAAPLYNNDRIQKYVNQVGRWVANHSERPNLPWRFAVLDSPLANAGAAAGGQIYITTGLLFRMRTESELAGALAHEIAHVVLRHHVKLHLRQKKSGAWKDFGANYAASKVGGGNVLAQAAKGYAIQLTAEGVRTILTTAFDRSEEEQADRMGVVLAARAGYDPYGLASTLQILQSVIGEQGSVSLIFSTHPNPNDRLANLEKSMAGVMDRYSGQATLQDRFASNILGMPVPSNTLPAKPPAKAPPKK